MKFSVQKPRENIVVLMRRLGYHFEKSSAGELVFYRPFSTSRFPRFHLYIRQEDEKLLFSLHLDQKAPSYGSSAAHSGEYDGEVVSNEVERVKRAIDGSRMTNS